MEHLSRNSLGSLSSIVEHISVYWIGIHVYLELKQIFWTEIYNFALKHMYCSSSTVIKSNQFRAFKTFIVNQNLSFSCNFHCRTNFRKFSIRFQGPKFFDSLSREIQNSESISVFGKRLKNFFCLNQIYSMLSYTSCPFLSLFLFSL